MTGARMSATTASTEMAIRTAQERGGVMRTMELRRFIPAAPFEVEIHNIVAARFETAPEEILEPASPKRHGPGRPKQIIEIFEFQFELLQRGGKVFAENIGKPLCPDIFTSDESDQTLNVVSG